MASVSICISQLQGKHLAVDTTELAPVFQWLTLLGELRDFPKEVKGKGIVFHTEAGENKM